MPDLEKFQKLNEIGWHRVRSCLTCKWGPMENGWADCKHPEAEYVQDDKKKRLPAHWAAACIRHELRVISTVDTLIDQLLAYGEQE